MESLNLNALAGSLPTSNLANAEKELLNNFRGTSPLFLSRSPHAEIHPTHVSPCHFFFPTPDEKKKLNKKPAAAMSITNLYRSSRSTSKRAYNSGYAAACADLLQMIQQGVSDSETPPTIGRVMDWVEARLEAVRAGEEDEEDEDEDSAGKKDAGNQSQTAKLRAGASSAPPRPNSAPAVPQQHTPREQVRTGPSSPPLSLRFVCLFRMLCVLKGEPFFFFFSRFLFLCFVVWIGF